ncbi:MAG: phage tail tape measure protein, partial [Ruminococcus sp.]
MASDGHLIFDTNIDYDGILNGLKELEKKLEGYTVGKDIFANLAADAIKAAGGAFSSAAQMGVEFEASMSRVQAVSGATADELENLTDLARAYGASTVFSSSECADALNYMAMAGWNVEQMTNGLSGILNLAAAAGEDLGTTSDIVTDALTAFGMSAEEAGHFADILATASSKSNTNVSMMGETFKYVAPVAGALGYSAEDVAVAVGLMANSGIKASQAGTSLRAILSNLTEPTDKQAEAMETLGISLTDSEGKMKSLDELMGDLRTGFSGLDEATQASYASIIGGQEAMSGLLAIVNASNTDFNNLKSAIYGCDGACDSMAETMTDNVSGELKTLQSMAEELQLSLYDMFQPALMKAIPKVQDAVGWITDHLDEIIAFAKPVSIALASIFAVNKAVKFCGAIKNIFSVINAGMSSNPVGMIFKAAEAVTVLGTTVFSLFDAMGKVPDYDGTLQECRQEIEETTAALELARTEYDENSGVVQQLESDLALLNRQYEQGGGMLGELEQEIEQVSNAYDAMKQEQEEAIQNFDNNEASGMRAVAMLESLSEKSELTAADLNLMKSYADYLNDNFNCNIQVNYDTGELTGFDPKDIAAQVAKIAQQNRADYAIKQITSADFVNEYLDAYEVYTKAKKEADEAFAEYQEAFEEYGYGGSEWVNSLYVEYENLKQAEDEAASELDNYNTNLDEMGRMAGMSAGAIEEYRQSLENTDVAIGDLQKSTEDAKESIDFIQEGITAAQDVLTQHQDRILEIAQAYDEAYDAAYSSFQGQFGL